MAPFIDVSLSRLGGALALLDYPGGGETLVLRNENGSIEFRIPRRSVLPNCERRR
jgi:hypothetical protein